MVYLNIFFFFYFSCVYTVVTAIKDKKLVELVVVVGGFGGIGFETCKSLLRREIANLAIFDLQEDEEKLKKMRDRHTDASIHFWKVDVTHKSQIERAFKSAAAKFKFIDVVVISAGIFDEQNPKNVIATNLLGNMYVNLVAIDTMSKNAYGRGGTVLNISSVLGLEPIGSYPVYCATKHGLVGFVRSLANEEYYNATGIKFIIACPGMTFTRMTDTTVAPLHPFMPAITPEIRQQTAYQCSQCLVAAIEINRNGSMWIIDEGQLTEVTPIKYFQFPEIPISSEFMA